MVDMPGVTIPKGWDDVPGLRGCTAEACGCRDANLRLVRALGLPTVEFGGETLLRRLTLLADPQGVVRKVVDKITDPGAHALEVLAYLKVAAGS